MIDFELKTKSDFVILYLFLGINPIYKICSVFEPKYSFEIGFGRPKHGLLFGFNFYSPFQKRK